MTGHGRVLVVDDQPQVLDMLREIVEHMGYETCTAASVEQAIAAMATVRPHVVFLDLLMPGMSSLKVLAHFREHHGAVPVIVITGNMDRRRALLAVALGFLQLLPRAPELRLLHRWLDTWTGLGLIVVGVERQGLRFSLSHITKGEWWRRSWPSVVLPTIRASTNSRNGWRVESKE